MDKTPKPYLSYSQYILFKKNPKEYFRRYFLGKAGYENEAMRFGKRLAEALEHQKDSGDESLERVRLFLPVYPNREFEFVVDIGGVPVKVKMDGVNLKEKKFGDHKTGKNWTQAMANRSEQLKIYGLALWKKYGWLPKEGWIHWVETRHETEEMYDQDTGEETGLTNTKIVATGKVVNFKVQFKLIDYLKMEVELKKCWQGIQKMARDYKKNPNLFQEDGKN